ncbi:MAG: HAMP domain-containing histidine kinase [Lachnospiraceae bacterium]|nr:HAMP domain-containing histidine kinase [Lachnospiraceae bacterium]
MTETKKNRTIMAFAVSVCLIILLGTMALYMREYRRSAFESNWFDFLSVFCETMVENDPEMEQMILDSLKFSEKYGTLDGRFLEQYGYRSEDFGNSVPTGLVMISVAVMSVLICGFLFIWWYPDRQKRSRIAELTDYLECINTGGEGTILMTKEDEFSHLQDEMYKTVTELYRTREQAVAAKINYAENLANIAHQLKTPITAAHLSLQMVVGNENYVSQVKKQLERLRYLEDALLTLSKIDAGVLKLESEEVDIYTVLNLAVDNLSDILSQKRVNVSIPEKGCVTFQGDMEWTMEALMNLMKNCMEHSPQGGMIHCDYSSNLLYTEIRIWDEGAGFAAEDLPHLFERFYRGNKQKEAAGKEIDRNDTGVGIGLSLARSILELQNGIITARNLPQGGACFEIRIYSH